MINCTVDRRKIDTRGNCTKQLIYRLNMVMAGVDGGEIGWGGWGLGVVLTEDLDVPNI